MRLHLSRTLRTNVEPSPNVIRVAAMFGLGVDASREIDLIPPTTIELCPGRVIFITGSSGGGKSTLLHLIADQLEPRDDAALIRFDALPDPPDRPLVDGFDGLPLEEVLRILSIAGLNDAFVMLRRPAELSDGQRYRLRLAQTIALVERSPAGTLPVVIADEFGATLDRVTAKVIASNVRKWVTRRGVCFIAATTHDDLLEPLQPDLLVDKALGQSIEVIRRGEKSGNPGKTKNAGKTSNFDRFDRGASR